MKLDYSNSPKTYTRIAVKLARIYNSPDHLDNYLDAICYLAEAAALVKMKEVE